MRMGSRVRELRTGPTSLVSREHANAAWPWQRLSLECADTNSLLCLPVPPEDGTAVIECHCVEFADLDQVRIRARHMALCSDTHTHV